MPSGKQAVVNFSLIDSVNGCAIAGYDPIPAGATINLAALPTRNLNIRANTSPSTVGSVRFGYDGNASYRTENLSPYTIGGKTSSGNYLAWPLATGSHTLTATPYQYTNATGKKGMRCTIVFDVIGEVSSHESSIVSYGAANPLLQIDYADTLSAPAGAWVTLWGISFGSSQGRGRVTIGSTQAVDYAYWDNTRIEFRVPDAAQSGQLLVVANGSKSNALNFTVRQGNIYYVDPNNAAASDAGVGSESAPWLTLTKAAQTAQAGDTVYVADGTYCRNVGPRPQRDGRVADHVQGHAQPAARARRHRPGRHTPTASGSMAARSPRSETSSSRASRYATSMNRFIWSWGLRTATSTAWMSATGWADSTSMERQGPSSPNPISITIRISALSSTTTPATSICAIAPLTTTR